MTVYTDKLPATKSEANAGFEFYKFDTDHGSDYGHTVGTLVIGAPGRRVEFLVDEFPTGWEGRGFHLAKLCGSIGRHDTECQSYDVFIGRNGQGNTCDCKGFTYSREKGCRHLASVMGCIANGWL